MYYIALGVFRSFFRLKNKVNARVLIAPVLRCLLVKRRQNMMMGVVDFGRYPYIYDKIKMKEKNRSGFKSEEEETAK